jgi:hypothetical protein
MRGAGKGMEGESKVDPERDIVWVVGHWDLGPARRIRRNVVRFQFNDREEENVADFELQRAIWWKAHPHLGPGYTTPYGEKFKWNYVNPEWEDEIKKEPKGRMMLPWVPGERERVEFSETVPEGWRGWWEKGKEGGAMGSSGRRKRRAVRAAAPADAPPAIAVGTRVWYEGKLYEVEWKSDAGLCHLRNPAVERHWGWVYDVPEAELTPAEAEGGKGIGGGGIGLRF